MRQGARSGLRSQGEVGLGASGNHPRRLSQDTTLADSARSALRAGAALKLARFANPLPVRV
jgi:hypothetical protein